MLRLLRTDDTDGSVQAESPVETSRGAQDAGRIAALGADGRFDPSVLPAGGPTDRFYAHVQGVASDEWVIDHNLGKYPSVSVEDSAQQQWMGEVVYDSPNRLRIKFAFAFSGKAFLN